ncbi:MAG TPA: glucose 1-dehydrogenase [Chloroflexota bacterium]|nr:glucose 1-dehydrogenase [Chloroflexota bacterium]
MVLEGKVAIVTGGGNGIGMRYCRGLSGEGAKVVVADLDEAAAKRVAQEVNGLGVRVDCANEDSVKAMVAQALDAYGRIDILVNNAAIFTEVLPRKSFEDIGIDEWDKVMAVNVRGVWLCSRAVAPVFKQQRGGVIVNISSGTIFSGSPGFMHYVSSKGAVWAMTRVLAKEMGEYGVRVNCITPGLTSSERAKAVYPEADMQSRAQDRRFKREQRPEDLVGTMIFLCSDASRFVTGQTLNVDGGTNMH